MRMRKMRRWRREEQGEEEEVEEREEGRKRGEGGKRPFKNAIGVIIGPETARYLGDIWISIPATPAV